MSDWKDFWSFVLQPILFSGLFIINIIIVVITIRNEMRIIKQNSENIIANAKHITENYEALQKLLIKDKK